jgi:hypothetical protein
MRVRRPTTAANQLASSPQQQEMAHHQDVAAPAHAPSTAAATGREVPAREQRDQPAATAGAPSSERTDSAPVLPYTDLADKVLGILTVKEIEPEQVSDVLRMSYEQNLTNRDIARRLELRNHHTVGKILDASAQVLREQPLAKVS